MEPDAVGSATWERVDGPTGLALARWERRADGWRFHGSELLVGADSMSCTFRIDVGPDWTTGTVLAVAISQSGETWCRVEVQDGRWTVDGAPRADLDGCVDVDVASTPLTNTFPISRLSSTGDGGPVTTTVAWVDVPSLEVTAVEQTYARLPDRDGLACWRYSDPTFGAFDLTVDDAGLVVDYQGLYRRLGADRRGAADAADLAE